MSRPSSIFANAGVALPFPLTRISSNTSPSTTPTTLKAPAFSPLLASLRRRWRHHLPLPRASVHDPVDEDELELLEKPSPPPPGDGEEAGGPQAAQGEQKLGADEVLAPFLKFFKGKDGAEGGDGEWRRGKGVSGKVVVEYYEPVPGDFVVGVVVSGNENKLDVNVGADLLG